MIAAGSSAHSDHGRSVAELLISTARGEAPGYEIKDEKKLMSVAAVYGIEVKDRTVEQIAEDVGKAALAEFGQQSGEIKLIARAPQRRQDLWRRHDIVPRGLDREIVETFHRTTMGVDQDYRNILMHGCRTALADGWGGSMIATELQDILFGTPGSLMKQPSIGTVGLGALKEDEVNIVIHGHEPLLSEMIVTVAQDPEMIEMAKKVGAKGINLAGLCCTANEVLLRQGVGIAGNFLQQEIALATGAVDAMVVDVQCIMASLPEVAECYHTKIVTTSPKAKMAGAIHVQFNEHDALSSAKEIIKMAIENFPYRGVNVRIPTDEQEVDIIAGFTHEYINYMLGGSFRASYWPLNDNIINGRIRGIAGVVGCNNPKVTREDVHANLVKELIANDVLVVQTGCSAITCGKECLMVPEAAMEYAGPGLREVCEAVGIPPVLHSGACVDNSRILIAASEMVRVGGLGDDISDLPVAGAAPEWMSEKAVAIGHYFVSSGVLTVFGVGMPISGSENVTNFLFNEIEDIVGGKWACEPDPSRMAAMIIDHIDQKRKALGIDVVKERVLYDMEMRRELEVV
jgi:carbon-monoxide dehydrogenase catalytic subunit